MFWFCLWNVLYSFDIFGLYIYIFFFIGWRVVLLFYFVEFGEEKELEGVLFDKCLIIEYEFWLIVD